MSISSRNPSSVALESGSVATVLVANFQEPYRSSRLMVPDRDDPSPIFRIHPRARGEATDPEGWGIGTRAIHLVTSGPPTPVLALRPDRDRGGAGGPARVTVLQGAVDPTIARHPTTGRFTLHYWVNGWSPPGPDPVPSPPILFARVRPPDPSRVDPSYLADPGYIGSQPGKDYTEVRDVPSWYLPGQAPDPGMIPGSSDERVGPFDLERFWVAPFTDAHLYRFPGDREPFPGQPPASPPSPPGPPPPPPPVVTDPSPDLIAGFPYLSTPQDDLTRGVSAVLQKVRDGQTLTPLERDTLDQYRHGQTRWAGLGRCTRVLMRAEGHLYRARRQEDGRDDRDPTASYLVVRPPQPVLALPRGVNKVLLGRPKMTTYLGPDVFITAALTYRYPAAATVSLCSGNPQVDFTIHSPSDRFDESRRPGILPESTDPQRSQAVSGATVIVPGRYGASLAEVLSNSTIW